MSRQQAEFHHVGENPEDLKTLKDASPCSLAAVLQLTAARLLSWLYTENPRFSENPMSQLSGPMIFMTFHHLNGHLLVSTNISAEHRGSVAWRSEPKACGWTESGESYRSSFGRKRHSAGKTLARKAKLAASVEAGQKLASPLTVFILPQ